MIILVDFENTHASGMVGYEYLNETDTVVMYYSDENSAITKGMVEDLKARHVNVRMVKLLKQYSNALDMYIASTTGMFLDSGEKICIVSKDKGYAAVKDFWHSLRNAEILLGETIEECFLHSVANDEERIRNAKERNQKALLTNSFETMNKIPTRPTLSHYGYRRRRTSLDTTRHLDPVVILPNPLRNPNLQDEEEGDMNDAAAVETKAADMKAAVEDTQRAAEPEKEKSRETGKTRGRGRRGKKEAEERESGKVTEPVKQDTGNVEAGNVDTERAAEPARKAAVSVPQDMGEVQRVIPRLNPNQVQYIYDPSTGQMKKVELAPAVEEPGNGQMMGQGTPATSHAVLHADMSEMDTSGMDASGMDTSEMDAASGMYVSEMDASFGNALDTAEGMAQGSGSEDTEDAAEKLKGRKRGSRKRTSSRKALQETEGAEAAPQEGEDDGQLSLALPEGEDAMRPDLQEIMEKYGSMANTLHQYYLKIMKVYGKAEGKPIYDATKKAVQLEIKRRKAEKATSEEALPRDGSSDRDGVPANDAEPKEEGWEAEDAEAPALPETPSAVGDMEALAASPTEDADILKASSAEDTEAPAASQEEGTEEDSDHMPIEEDAEWALPEAF